ncbi:MAG: TIR domain-containing protein [Actinomycetota bacterium]
MDRQGSDSESSHDVFISYAREDQAVATLLKQRLQQLGRRWFQLQAMKVFLDTTDLIGADSLWDKIAREIESSRHLLVLVSRASSESTYVLRELNHFAEQNPMHRVSVVLLDDPSPWADYQEDTFLDDDPLRQRLRELYDDEPHYVDLRSVDLESFNLTDQSVRSTVAQISAPILGVDKDRLVDQEHDRQKFRVRFRNAAIGVLTALLVGVIVLAVQANANADRANENAALADQNAIEAVANAEAAEENAQEAIANAEEARRAQAESDSQRVALVSESFLDADPELSVLLAIEALALTPSQEAIDAAGRALLASNTIGLSALADERGGATVRSADDGTVITAGRSGVVQRWAPDLSTEPDVLVDLGRPVTALDLWGDGQIVAAGHDDGTLSIWTAESSDIVELAGHQGAANSVRFVNEGTLVSGGDDNAVRLWSLAEMTQAGSDLRAHDLEVLMVAPSPDGSLVASAGAGGRLFLWSLGSNAEPELLEDSETPVGAVAWSASGELLAWSVDRRVQLLDRSDSTQQRGEHHDDFVTSLAFSPDDRFLVSGSEDSTVRLWATDVLAPVGRPLSGPRSEVLAVDYADGGLRVVAGSQDGTIRSWSASDPEQASVVFSLPNADVGGAVSIHPDGSMVATNGSNGVLTTASLWDPFSLEPVQDLSALGEFVFTLAISPSGETLATGGPSLVQLYNLDDQEIVEIEVNLANATYLSWAPGGNHLIVADLQGRAFLIDAESASVEASWFDPRLAKPTAVRFIDDETVVLANDEGALRTLTIPALEVAQEIQAPEVITALAVAPSREEIFAVTGWTGSLLTYRTDDLAAARSESTARHPGGIRGVTVSPNGERLVTAGLDGQLQIWSTETGRKIGEPIAAFGSGANRIAYDPSGRFIVATSGDGTAIVWPTEPDELTRRLCGTVSRTISAVEWSLHIGDNVVRPELSTCTGEPLPDSDDAPQAVFDPSAVSLELLSAEGEFSEDGDLPAVVGLRLTVGLFVLRQAGFITEFDCGSGSTTTVDETIDQLLFSFNPPVNITSIEESEPGVVRVTTDGDACNFRFPELAGGRR